MSDSLETRVLPNEQAMEALSGYMRKGGTHWFLDIESRNRITLNGSSEPPYSIRSEYQRLDVLKTPRFGLCMILDGRIQLTERDEWIYHELLAHPACVVHGEPKRAIVLGGGDGCAARELLKYESIREITVADIDEEVLNAFRDRFSSINRGALSDPKTKIVCDDALAYLERQEEPYDVIISDLTEPFDPTDLAGDLSQHLYTDDFYALVQDHLSENGCFVCQTGGVICHPDHDRYHISLVKSIRDGFSQTKTAYEFVPSFNELWSITLASKNALEISPEAVNERLRALGVGGLRYYDGASHTRAFNPPLFLRSEFFG